MNKKKILKTNSITLTLIEKKDKLLNIEIPFDKIYVLEIEGITTTIGHNENGEFMEFLHCSTLNLKVYKNKIKSELLQQIKEKSILSITLNFNDNSCKSYNVPWSSDDFVNNKLQNIKEEDDIIKIIIKNH